MKLNNQKSWVNSKALSFITKLGKNEYSLILKLFCKYYRVIIFDQQMQSI